MIQCFSVAASVTTECFLLATMAYNHYVAICKPVLYLVITASRLYVQLLFFIILGGFLHDLIHESLFYSD